MTARDHGHPHSGSDSRKELQVERPAVASGAGTEDQLSSTLGLDDLRPSDRLPFCMPGVAVDHSPRLSIADRSYFEGNSRRSVLRSGGGDEIGIVQRGFHEHDLDSAGIEQAAQCIDRAGDRLDTDGKSG